MLFTGQWHQEPIPFPLLIAFLMIMGAYSLSILWRAPYPNRMSLDKASFLTDLTQRSAPACKFGLRAGSLRGVTPAAYMVS